MNISKIITQSVVSVFLIGTLVAPASATLLTGTTGFGGDIDLNAGGSATTNLSSADKIVFGDFVMNTQSGDKGTDFNFSSTTSAASPVPLPAAAWLFGSALLGFVSLSRRKQA